MPLSVDIPSNPFRCRSETSRGSQPLLHAILAVSCYHASRQANKDEYSPIDVVDHQNTALKLYHDQLDTYNGSQGVQLLDTTMVLFLFKVRRQICNVGLIRY
jgi:Fungal specific transcription factor domain